MILNIKSRSDTQTTSTVVDNVSGYQITKNETGTTITYRYTNVYGQELSRVKPVFGDWFVKVSAGAAFETAYVTHTASTF